MKKLYLFLCSLLACLVLFTSCGSPSQDRSKGSDHQAQSIQTSLNQTSILVEEDQAYTDKDHVAAYIHQYGHLPPNYITKKEAQALGWKDKGSLDKIAPGKSIGGDRFGNYQEQLPHKEGRTWKEADIDYIKGNRNGKRLIYSNDGLVYYTDDHYKTFKEIP